jgi:hypothetical protein
MSRLVRLCVLCVLGMVATRCTSEPPPPTPSSLTVTSSVTSVAADGTSTVVVDVSGATTPVRLTTTQGAWQDSGRSTTTIPGNGSATLVTCDSRIVAACGGSVRISAAADSGASGTVLLSFNRLEMCANSLDDDGDGHADCADTECNGKTCLLPQGAVGTGVCTSAGACICDKGVVEVCNDGLDNNCDGKVDCAETACGNQTCKLPSGFDGVCKNSSCACPATAESCSNSIDDDCNGKVDCADGTCQPAGGNPGKLCDTSRGLTCGAPDAGSSTCDVCPGLEALAEVTCNDSKDNDCDAKIDCADQGCDGKTCAVNGRQCANLLCECSGNGGVAQTLESTCNDGADNDCDGKVDCLDTDCATKVCGANGRTCSGTSCLCTGNGGTAQPTDAGETICDDNADNDCDGLVDCAETYCRPVANDPGKFCDTTGHTCSVPQNGVSTCTVCTVKLDGGIPQGNETLCFDAQDNDCDGVADCQDSECAGRLCSAAGKVCANLTCSCPGSPPENICDDGKDNDCNGFVDCKDQGCQPFGGNAGLSCGANGLVCTGSGTSANCTCSGNGGTIQASEGTGGDAGVPTCGDNFDNDCDGYADCLDVNCRALPLADGGMIAGKDCSHPNGTPLTVGMQCDAVGQCICPAGQSSEVSCSDGIDNDCDGLADCADNECNGSSCGSFGLVCNGNLCACPSPTAPVEICKDFIDNNCDGKVDCADSACSPGAQCDPTSPLYQCSAGVCTDTSSNFSLQLVATPSRIAANGLATSTIAATLKKDGTPQGNGVITFAVGPSGTVLPITGTTNAQGQTSTQYISSSNSGGLQTVTGSYNTGLQTIYGSVVIDTPVLGQVKFVKQQYSIMGVKFSSYQESNEVTFQVLDNVGAPYPAGLEVTFKHSPVGGSYIGPTMNCSLTECTAAAVTDATGTVKVTLHSGTVASVVSVIAEATAGAIPGLAIASNIAIVGAKPSGSNIAINCTPRNVPAFFDDDCLNSFVSATVNCAVTLGDRFQNVLGVSTQTTFSTEAGLAGAPQLTNKDGVANGTVSVANAKLPVDVEPLEPLAKEWRLKYNSGCGEKVHNPRDGLVTIIASANGEEGFVDGSNGKPSNGTYDPGENFIDIGEPYVDANDNGIRDANETYLDSNNNGLWDGPNGMWDSTKVIWAETRILYSGHATIYEAGGLYMHSRWYSQGAIPPPPTVAPNFCVWSSLADGGIVGTTDYLDVYFTDKNFNQLNSQTTYTVVPITTGVQTKFTSSPAVVDNLGLNFTQQFCDTPSGGTCSNTCRAAPCYVVTNIGGFSYGNYGVVEIKGGNPPAAGASVSAEAKYGNVTVGLPITGTCQ